MSCAVNTSAEIRPDEKGSKTEIAILRALDKFGCPFEEIKKKYPVILKKIPFSSARKRMSVIVQDQSGKHIMLTKGASELILASCSYFHNMVTNTVVKLDSQLTTQIEENIFKMAHEALRTICLAYKYI